MIDPETIGKVADASGEVAKTTETALKLAGKFGSYFDGALSTAGKMLENEIRFIAAKRGVRLSEKWNEFMDARGLPATTRQIPTNFALPLLTAAVLEENDELQDTWARLLVNAGDGSTPMELRTAYVEILKGMSAFDVKNLAKLAKETLSRPPGSSRTLGAMKVLHPELMIAGKAGTRSSSGIGCVACEPGAARMRLARWRVGRFRYLRRDYRDRTRHRAIQGVLLICTPMGVYRS